MSTETIKTETDNVRRLGLALLGLLCLLPAIETAVAIYFELWPQWTYPLLKGLMIVVPLLVWRWRRWSPRLIVRTIGLARPSWRGLLFGVVMGGAILAGYYLVIQGRLDSEGIVAKVESLGLSGWRYWAMSIFISLMNSAFEEYYWRGFLLTELRMRIFKPAMMLLVGAALFGIHHIFALAPLFPWPWTIAFTAGTAVGGGVWTWMRLRNWSLADCYVSHVMADMAIMWLGWTLLNGA